MLIVAMQQKAQIEMPKRAETAGHDIMLIVAMQQKAQIEMRKTSQKTQTKLPCTFIDGAKRC